MACPPSWRLAGALAIALAPASAQAALDIEDALQAPPSPRRRPRRAGVPAYSPARAVAKGRWCCIPAADFGGLFLGEGDAFACWELHRPVQGAGRLGDRCPADEPSATLEVLGQILPEPPGGIGRRQDGDPAARRADADATISPTAFHVADRAGRQGQQPITRTQSGPHGTHARCVAQPARIAKAPARCRAGAIDFVAARARPAAAAACGLKSLAAAAATGIDQLLAGATRAQVGLAPCSTACSTSSLMPPTTVSARAGDSTGGCAVAHGPACRVPRMKPAISSLTRRAAGARAGPGPGLDGVRSSTRGSAPGRSTPPPPPAPPGRQLGRVDGVGQHLQPPRGCRSYRAIRHSSWSRSARRCCAGRWPPAHDARRWRSAHSPWPQPPAPRLRQAHVVPRQRARSARGLKNTRKKATGRPRGLRLRA